MSGKDFHMHFVSTRDEAREFAKGRKTYWVSTCGCREGRAEAGEKCKRSRQDVCLYWRDGTGSSTNGVKKIGKAEVEALFTLAEKAHLVTRPFRNQGAPKEIDGVCFCCDDCCAYFNGDESSCDPGALTQKTDKETCSACGSCEEVCFFGARKLVKDVLRVNARKCKGCGVCLDVCPTRSIEMAGR